MPRVVVKVEVEQKPWVRAFLSTPVFLFRRRVSSSSHFNDEDVQKMLEKHHIEAISAEEFTAVLASYDDEVSEKLHKLEEQRVHTIPKALSERKPAYLTKPEVQTLVDWKLYVENAKSAIQMMWWHLSKNLTQRVAAPMGRSDLLFGSL